MTFIRHLLRLAGCNPLAPKAPRARGGWRRKLSARIPSPYRDPQGLTEGPSPVRVRVEARALRSGPLQPSTNLRGSPSAARISLYINLGAGLVGAACALAATNLYIVRPLWGPVAMAGAGTYLIVAYSRRKGFWPYRKPRL